MIEPLHCEPPSTPRSLSCRRGSVLPAALLASLFVAAAGCQKAPPPGPKVAPVSGQISVNGEKAIGAHVTFHRVGETNPKAITPYAVVEGDGWFRPSTIDSFDGALPGDYVVTVTWPTIRVEGGEEIEGPDRLQGRYATREHPAAKVTVVDGENEYPPFELK